MIEIITGSIVVGTVVVGIGLLSCYRIVDSSKAHLVVSPFGNKRMVCSPDEKMQKNGGSSWYFDIPIIRTVKEMDVTVRELAFEQIAYEQNQGRYLVKSSTKYRIVNVLQASETFTNFNELEEKMKKIIQAATNAVTVKYSVIDARIKKSEIAEAIKNEIVGDIEAWGLLLVSFQLVDFRDTEDSTIISDISRRREVEINSDTRIQNAEKLKLAKIKEAEAVELARRREIAKDEEIAMAEQNMKQKIEVRRKEAETSRFEVVKVQAIKQAEINKEQAEINAEQEKKVAEIKAEQDKVVAVINAERDKQSEEIIKEKKRLDGEGTQLKLKAEAEGEKFKLEQLAKGNAAKFREEGLAQAEAIKEKGLAEAIAKDKLQEALRKFNNDAIMALVAEQLVEKDKSIGVATANALSKAELKIFSGDNDSSSGFQLGKMMEALGVSNQGALDSLLHRLKVPNDLGININGIKDSVEIEDKSKDSVEIEDKSKDSVEIEDKSKDSVNTKSVKKQKI